jgi:hypothetical protein
MTKMARQGKASRQDGKGWQGKGRKDTRQGMPSSSARHRQGKDARHRHAIIGIGMPSACHHRQQQDAGRQNAAKWRSIVIQILKEC